MSAMRPLRRDQFGQVGKIPPAGSEDETRSAKAERGDQWHERPLVVDAMVGAYALRRPPGLLATGRDYESFVFLLERSTRPAAGLEAA